MSTRPAHACVIRASHDPGEVGHRTAARALLWVSAVIVMVLSTAAHEYTYRYVIAAVPLLCMAAGFALRKPAPRDVSRASEPET
jgi:hypothetical protein